MTRLSIQIALTVQLATALRLKSKAGQCNDEWNPATWLGTTDETFELEKECADLEDDDCVCFREGTVDWDLGRSPDNYFNSDDYQELTRQEKLAELWEQMTGVPRGFDEAIPARVKCQNFDDLWQHFPQGSGRSYSNEGDEMNNSTSQSRLKLVHQQGVVGLAKWVPIEEGVSQNGYTGIFASGSDSALIRFSDDFFVEGLSGNVKPSLAIKFLRDGVKSGNQFGMVSFDGDADEDEPWNWWAYELHNHLPQFNADAENTCSDSGVLDRSQTYSGECGPQTAGRWNAESTKFIFQNGSVDMALWDEDGNEPDWPVFPFKMDFVPNPDLVATDGDSRFYSQLVEGGSAEIPADTLLYTVWGVNGALDSDEWYEIAEIYSTSTFQQSLWADERLFFQHSGLNSDLQYLDDNFRSDNKFQKNVPSFNFDKYGEWDNPGTFEDWEATSDDVVAGMATSGCPFAFLIDQINTLGPLT